MLVLSRERTFENWRIFGRKQISFFSKGSMSPPLGMQTSFGSSAQGVNFFQIVISKPEISFWDETFEGFLKIAIDFEFRRFLIFVTSTLKDPKDKIHPNSRKVIQ